MRISVARCVLVVLIGVGLAGCRSGSSWSMPSLAFWKSNPFKSSSGPSVANKGIPTPSEIAGKPNSPSGSTASAPGTGYQRSTGIPGAPAVTYPSTGVSSNAPYTNLQQPYASTQPASSPNYGVGSSTTPYLASQPNSYRSSGSTARGSASPYNAATPYLGTSPSSYAGSSAAPYGSLGSSRNTPSTSTTAGTAGPYANPVRSSTPNGSTADRYGASTDRYGSRAAAGSGYRTSTGSSSSSYVPGSGSYYSGGSTGSGYAAGLAPPYGPLSTPGSTSGTSYGRGDGSSVNPRYGSNAYGSNPYGSNPYGGNPYGGGGAAKSSASQARPAATPPLSTGGSGASPYTPGATGYTPGKTGFSPPGVAPYQPPTSPYTSPAGSSAVPTPYQPGSVRSYDLPKDSVPVPGRMSSYSGSSPRMGSAVKPADYRTPAIGSR